MCSLSTLQHHVNGVDVSLPCGSFSHQNHSNTCRLEYGTMRTGGCWFALDADYVTWIAEGDTYDPETMKFCGVLEFNF